MPHAPKLDKSEPAAMIVAETEAAATLKSEKAMDERARLRKLRRTLVKAGVPMPKSRVPRKPRCQDDNDLPPAIEGRCNARTKVKGGTGRCAMWPEPGKLRCRLHGGRSTGPKTSEGRARQITATREAIERRRLHIKLGMPVPPRKMPLPSTKNDPVLEDQRLLSKIFKRLRERGEIEVLDQIAKLPPAKRIQFYTELLNAERDREFLKVLKIAT